MTGFKMWFLVLVFCLGCQGSRQSLQTDVGVDSKDVASATPAIGFSAKISFKLER